MPRVQLARQPIFDRDLVVIGYELLFRDSHSGATRINGADQATTNVVLGSFTELGLDHVVGSTRAWINVSREFVLSGLVTTLPADRVGLEILEGQVVDDELTAAVATLHREGYRFALDDFNLKDGAEALIPYAEVIKLDLLALGRDGLADHVRRLRRHPVALLAEKVETPEDHAFARRLGCHRFQGFFYRRPELLSRRRIAAGQTSLMRLVAELQRSESEQEMITDWIGHDVGLSLRLLRYINSAYVGLGHKVTSVNQAVTLLGPSALRRWAMLCTFAGLAKERSELTRLALGRARFCELASLDGDPAQRFTVGLFSVVDALTDTPIEEALRPVPFPEEMREALILHQGPMGRLLDAVAALEEGSFELAELLCPDATDRYLEALEWADEIASALAEEAVGVAA